VVEDTRLRPWQFGDRRFRNTARSGSVEPEARRWWESLTGKKHALFAVIGPSADVEVCAHPSGVLIELESRRLKNNQPTMVSPAELSAMEWVLRMNFQLAKCWPTLDDFAGAHRLDDVRS